MASIREKLLWLTSFAMGFVMMCRTFCWLFRTLLLSVKLSPKPFSATIVYSSVAKKKKSPSTPSPGTITLPCHPQLLKQLLWLTQPPLDLTLCRSMWPSSSPWLRLKSFVNESTTCASIVATLDTLPVSTLTRLPSFKSRLWSPFKYRETKTSSHSRSCASMSPMVPYAYMFWRNAMTTPWHELWSCKDSRIRVKELLVASYAPTGSWVCQVLWHMCLIQGSQASPLWPPPAFTHPQSAMGIHLYGLHHGSTSCQRQGLCMTTFPPCYDNYQCCMCYRTHIVIKFPMRKKWPTLDNTCTICVKILKHL
jgi:hypothetical protein